MKAVFDTNVYISGFLFKGGIPSRLLDLAYDRRFELYHSPDILEEFKRILAGKFELTLYEQDKALRFVQSLGQVVYPEEKVQIVPADEAGNRILECAFAARADYLVTGDKKHLLPIKKQLPFKIILPADFYSAL